MSARSFFPRLNSASFCGVQAGRAYPLLDRSAGWRFCAEFDADVPSALKYSRGFIAEPRASWRPSVHAPERSGAKPAQNPKQVQYPAG